MTGSNFFGLKTQIFQITVTTNLITIIPAVLTDITSTTVILIAVVVSLKSAALGTQHHFPSETKITDFWG